MTFGVGPIFSGEGEPAETHFQVGAELVFRQIAFEPPAFFAFGIEYEDRRRPERVEAPEIFRIFLDVNPKRNEGFFDERRQTGVIVRLLFEPQTGTSGRRGAEIDEQWFVLIFGPGERLVGVFDPIY